LLLYVRRRRDVLQTRGDTTGIWRRDWSPTSMTMCEDRRCRVGQSRACDLTHSMKSRSWSKPSWRLRCPKRWLQFSHTGPGEGPTVGLCRRKTPYLQLLPLLPEREDRGNGHRAHARRVRLLLLPRRHRRSETPTGRGLREAGEKGGDTGRNTPDKETSAKRHNSGVFYRRAPVNNTVRINLF
jgi:hypothetical protein